MWTQPICPRWLGTLRYDPRTCFDLLAVISCVVHSELGASLEPVQRGGSRNGLRQTPGFVPRGHVQCTIAN